MLALVATPRLESLDLDFCGIGDSGIIALAHVLHHLPRLMWLQLDGNDVTQSGAVVLAASLSSGAAPALREPPSFFFDDSGDGSRLPLPTESTNTVAGDAEA